MKKLVRETSPEQQEKIKELASRLKITETTASILFARGQDTEEKMQLFLHPSKENFLSPFLMRGMREAVELIKRAREEEWRVAVFGDYDADGIGACAILSRALQEYGVEPYLYIPEREEGYGLSTGAIDKIFDEFLPDLLITVDCGISNAAEVEYVKEQGAFVIVTDHHELPETLPDCICINPKLKDDYPYDNLCGAGVAFKLASALIGERANLLLDFCALSTVADSVPLLGENRDIVYEGLKLIENAPRTAFLSLLGKPGEVTAQTLAFTIAPRLNAAGRMGDARSALRLFTTEDESEIFELAAKLNAYNMERQSLCDDLYEKARRGVIEEGAYGNVVMLVGEDWHAGLLGIVAARLAEEYSRPALLFVKKGDMLRGSARSIDSINIFEALKACSEWIEEFGGHSQAAGVNVKAENFENLKNALNAYVGSHYKREDFEPTLVVSGEITGEFPWRLARELNALEPYGMGNRRPLFVAKAGKLNATLLKPLSPHVAVTAEMDYMYFGGAKDIKLLRSDVEKQLVFECNLSTFRGKESLKGFIRAVCYDGASGKEPALDGFEGMVRTLFESGAQAEEKTSEELNRFIEEQDLACAYGLLVIAQDGEALKDYPAVQNFPREVYRLTSGSVRNTVLLAPAADCDLSAYRDIVFLERPLAVPFKTGKAVLHTYAETGVARRLKGIDLSREAMVGAFKLLRDADGSPAGESFAETARQAQFGGIDPKQLVFAMAVFEELGLVSFEGGRIRIIYGKKTELTSSKIYAAAVKLTE